MAYKSTDQFRRLQRASNGSRCHLAIALGQRYCRRYPRHVPAWLFYGRALAEAARYAESRNAFERAMELAPLEHQATILSQRGHTEALAGDYAAAETWYRQAFAASPTDGEHGLYLGEILFKQGKLLEAEASLRLATVNWSELLHAAWHLLGEVLASQERYSEALKYFEQAAENAPECQTHRNLVREMKAIIRRRDPSDTQ